MKLDEVPGGSIYVDTNILYMYLRADPTHLSILTTFFRRVVRGAFEAFVGIPVLDELFYRLLLARVRDATGRNPLDVLRTMICLPEDTYAVPTAALAMLDELQLSYCLLETVGLDRAVRTLRNSLAS
jgi:predicted nucleic acid-binding protein